MKYPVQITFTASNYGQGYDARDFILMGGLDELLDFVVAVLVCFDEAQPFPGGNDGILPPVGAADWPYHIHRGYQPLANQCVVTSRSSEIVLAT